MVSRRANKILVILLFLLYGIWLLCSEYILFVAVCQLVLKSDKEDMINTFKKLVWNSLSKSKPLTTIDNKHKLVDLSPNSPVIRVL